jgi:hypothetical protein
VVLVLAEELSHLRVEPLAVHLAGSWQRRQLRQFAQLIGEVGVDNVPPGPFD